MGSDDPDAGVRIHVLDAGIVEPGIGHYVPGGNKDDPDDAASVFSAGKVVDFAGPLHQGRDKFDGNGRAFEVGSELI